MGAHLVSIDGVLTFQSDKYPGCPAGKVPLSVKDKAAQPLLWLYAMGHRGIDPEFTEDLLEALALNGFVPPTLALESQEQIIVALVHALKCVTRRLGIETAGQGDARGMRAHHDVLMPAILVLEACGVPDGWYERGDGPVPVLPARTAEEPK